MFKDAVPKIVLTSLALPLSKGSPCHLGSPPGGRRREGEDREGEREKGGGRLNWNFLLLVPLLSTLCVCWFHVA